ncbi:hypothetical protein TrVE_jg3282 [Triparma verrucosa]|uniref:Uncharacterized protein n=1 Tax=Triparma verrucosa TaxID=1606542 RepID=A0A9W7BDQ8_9STRA|nr:hypothetical protein TrVE_jg3282 [Triparma verrucosa]
MGSDSKKKKSKSGSKSDSSSKSKKSKSDSSSSKKRSKSKEPKSDSSSKSKSKDKGKEGSSAAPPAVNPLSASMEFEAGMAFSKYENKDSGMLDKAHFVQLYKDMAAAPPAGGGVAGMDGGAKRSELPQGFMAGQLFERYSRDEVNGERRMNMTDFEKFVEDNKDMLRPGAMKNVHFEPAGSNALPVSFQAGQLFERFGDKSTLSMRKADFEKLIMETKPPSSGMGGAGNEAFNAANLYSRYKLDQNGGSQDNWSGAGPTYSHYNETTGVPLTEKAAAAHVATGQSVTTLEDAYGKRLGRLSALAAQNLAPRREQLSQLRHLILQRSDEVKEVSAAIQKETMADLDGILERLNAAESLKQAALQQQLNECTAELESVDRLVDKITAGSEAAASASGLSSYKRWGFEGEKGGGQGKETTIGMIGFIQIYPELSSAIERLVSRHVHTKVEEVSDDLPREMAERNEVVRKVDKYEQALAVKDQMLWAMLKDKESWDEKMEGEKDMNKEYAQEMGEWLTLTNDMSEEINRLREDHGKERERLEQENEKLMRELDSMKEKVSILSGL